MRLPVSYFIIVNIFIYCRPYGSSGHVGNISQSRNSLSIRFNTSTLKEVVIFLI